MTILNHFSTAYFNFNALVGQLRRAFLVSFSRRRNRAFRRRRRLFVIYQKPLLMRCDTNMSV